MEYYSPEPMTETASLVISVGRFGMVVIRFAACHDGSFAYLLRSEELRGTPIFVEAIHGTQAKDQQTLSN